MSNEIKNIVLDFNGVISKVNKKELISKVSFRDLCELICFGFSYLTKSGLRLDISRAYKGLKQGLTSSEDFYDLFDYTLPNKSKLVQKIMDSYVESMHTREGLIQLVDHLRENGLKVFILSNSIPQTEALIKSESIRSHFDGVFCSSEQGSVKPDPITYEIACKMWGILPEESLFIDDNKENVLGAQKAGFKKSYYLTKEEEIVDQISQNVLQV